MQDEWPEAIKFNLKGTLRSGHLQESTRPERGAIGRNVAAAGAQEDNSEDRAQSHYAGGYFKRMATAITIEGPTSKKDWNMA